MLAPYLNIGSLILRNQRYLYIFLLFVITLWLMYPASILERPISGDHTVHYFKAHQFKEILLQERSLWSWSHALFAGYPPGYNYPIGGELWVVAIHSMTLGLLDFEQSYALAIWAMMFLLAFSVFRLGALTISNHVGFIAAILVLTEKGATLFTGWRWVMTVGVWPSALALAFSILAVTEFIRLAISPHRGSASLAGLFLGLALLTHPLQIFHFAFFLPFVTCLLILPQRKNRFSTLALTLAATLSGVLISCVWLIPFLSVSEFHVAEFFTWTSLAGVGEMALRGGVIPGHSALFSILGVLGCLSLCFRSKPVFLLIGVLPLLFLTASSTSFLDTLRLFVTFDKARYVHWSRLTMLAQPYLALGAGFALVMVFRGALPWAVCPRRDSANFSSNAVP